jgi:hypothetical protein
MAAELVAERTDAQTHRFELEFIPPSRRFDVHIATLDEIPALLSFTAGYLPAVEAARLALHAIQEKSQSLLAIGARGKLVGAFALMSLNDRGLELLLGGRLSIADPDLSCLTRPDERASAIYAWALCLPGAGVGAVGNLMTWLRQPSYIGCDIYACAGSTDGDRFIRKTGFQQLPQSLNGRPIWVYRRRNAQALVRKGNCDDAIC